MKEKYKKLAYAMRRANEGEPLTVAFLGGSITEGIVASSTEKCYAYLVYQWWCETFPDSHISYVNAGIGGTTSHFGVGRVEEDILSQKPDVVFIDFTVNDVAEEFFRETFEGLLRRILYSDTEPAVMILNNVQYDTGINAQEYHNSIADYYKVPYVSVKDTIYRRMLEGEFDMSYITPDALHPNDVGHRMVADELIKELKMANCHLESEPQSEDKLPPMTENAYEYSKRIDNRISSPSLHGFRKDMNPKERYLDVFKRGWMANKAGDRFTIELEASCIAVQYRKTIRRPAPVARLVLDGDMEKPIILDSNFDEDWGDCLYLKPVLHHGKKDTHRIDIEIIKATEDDNEEFYLMSFIVS